MSSRSTSKSRLTERSFVFEKIIPAMLILLGAIMLVLILFALGVLLGVIRF